MGVHSCCSQEEVSPRASRLTGRKIRATRSADFDGQQRPEIPSFLVLRRRLSILTLRGYIESRSGKLRDELLDRELFDTLLEAKVLIKGWREHYNTARPHSSLGYRPPAPEASERGWPECYPDTNLNTGTFPGGRSG
jgi:transposase InsO family protein